MSKLRQTKSEVLQELVERYREATGEHTVVLREVAAWAVRTEGWRPSRKTAVDQLSQELSHALREEYYTDPQGRRVRKKHAQRTWRIIDEKNRQLVLWHDVTEATRPQMQAAFQQRRHGIVMDCRQLKQDVDSYNENHNNSVPIQMKFGFEEDLEELEHGQGALTHSATGHS